MDLLSISPVWQTFLHRSTVKSSECVTDTPIFYAYILYPIVHMTWLIAILETLECSKHLLRILKQKNLALPRRKKRVIPRTLCLGANGLLRCRIYASSLYKLTVIEVFQLHHFESLVLCRCQLLGMLRWAFDRKKL